METYVSMYSLNQKTSTNPFKAVRTPGSRQSPIKSFRLAKPADHTMVATQNSTPQSRSELMD